MGLRSTLTGWFSNERALVWPPPNWSEFLSYGGHSYALMPQQTLYGAKQEQPEASFQGYVEQAYKTNGVIFACMLARFLLFSEARFQFQQMRQGRPGDLFGTADLTLLETPWPGGTTGDLLTRAIQDADLAGNFYAYRKGDSIIRMRPDWVTIILGSDYEADDPRAMLEAQVVGYSYKPAGYGADTKPLFFLPEQVAHFAPIPDPIARYRGMSWLTPVLRELMNDNAATDFKLKFFEQGGTPNMVISTATPFNKDSFKEWVEVMRSQSEGAINAYKTLYLGAGATADVVGSNFQQIDFKATQSLGETRIAACAGVPPVIVGLTQGLESATYSNYQQSIRRFVDLTMRTLWRNIAGSLAPIVNVPGGSRLWYDARDIPALDEDEKDAADIRQKNAISMRQLVDAGFDPDTVVDAVTSGDLSRLSHTGLFSVQLQPPGTPAPSPDIPASKNGQQPALPAAAP